MSVKSGVEKREKTLAELIVVLVLLTLIMAHFISYFMKQNQQIEDTGFDVLANNFLSKVNIVHAQWLMDKKPNIVQVSSPSLPEKEQVSINKQGWIDINLAGSSLVCQKIWQLGLNMPMSFMQSPVAALEIRKRGEETGRQCRYTIESGKYFEYFTQNGKVVISPSVIE